MAGPFISDDPADAPPLNPVAQSLMSLRSRIPENTGLPPPQFFMDPRALSLLNMARGGLESMARWTQGVTDGGASLRPQDMATPTGAAALLSPFAAMPRGAIGANAFRHAVDDVPFDLPANGSALAKSAEPAAPAVKRPEGEIFDYSTHDQLPPGNPLQLPELKPYEGRGPNADMQALLSDGRVTRAVNKSVEAGLTPELRDATLNWYNMLPLRERFHDLYRGGDPDAAFLRFNQALGSMSPQNRVPENMAQGSWLYSLLEQGKPIPTDHKKVPAGFGGTAMKTRLSVARNKFGEEGGDVYTAPKTEFFGRSLAGDDSVPVVDSHAVRTMAMATKDPRFMKSKLRQHDSATDSYFNIEPRNMVESGEMSMREALKHPTFWGWRNDKGLYAPSTVPFTRAGDKFGISPGQAQAASWYGNAEKTGVKTQPFTAMEILEQKIRENARNRSISPEQMLDDMINGRAHLLESPMGEAVGLMAHQQPQQQQMPFSE